MSQGEHAWSIFVTETDGDKKLFRMRQSLPPTLVQSAFSECVMIDWRYGGKLPDQMTGARLAAFEDLLALLDDEAGDSLQVMVITGNGKREWVYYTKNYDRFMLALNGALAGDERFPIEIEHAHDPAWGYWSKINGHLKEAEAVSGEHAVDVGTLKLAPAQAAAYEAAGKKIAASAAKLLKLKLADYVTADAREFVHLNLPYYEKTSAALREAGLTQVIDTEPLDHTRESGKRVLMRFQLSQTEPLCAVIYSIYPRPQNGFVRFLLRLIGKKTRAHPAGTLEFENEFSDGKYICTNNSQGKNPFTKPQEFDSLQMPPDATAQQVLEKHRQRLKDYQQANPGVQMVRVNNLEEISTQGNRQRALKATHRRAIGGITRAELQALAKEKFPFVEQHVMAEMRRLIEEFDKNEGAAAEPANLTPAMAGHLAGDGYARFLKVVEADFAGRGLAITIDDGTAVVKSTGQRYGLQNLAQVCSMAPPVEWPATVAQHFAIVSKTVEEVDALTDRFKDFAQAAPHLSVRLYPADAMQGVGAQAPVMRTDLEGVASVLVLDLPDSMMSVGRWLADQWGKSDDELFAVALDWLRRDSTIEAGETPLAADVKVQMIASDGFYAASRALLLDEQPACVGKYGAIVGVPHRHGLLAYPIENIEVVKAVKAMLPGVRGMHQQGPGSISSDLYWYRDGSFVRLPTQQTDNKLVFTPPEGFVALLNELAGKGAKQA